MKGYVAFNIWCSRMSLRKPNNFFATSSPRRGRGHCSGRWPLRLIRALSDDFPIHASTQMTVTSAGGIEFARELGCNLVVLARECS